MNMNPIHLLLPFVLLVPGVARGQAAPNFPSGRSTPVFQVNLPGGAVWVRLDTVSASSKAPADRNRAFRAAIQVYKSLKIPTDIVDTTVAQLGNLNLVVNRTFAGSRMSTWLRCGESMTGPNADTFRIYMAVVTGVERATDDSSRVRTLLTGTARNMAGGASNPIPCSTTGMFEEMVGRKIVEELGKGS